MTFSSTHSSSTVRSTVRLKFDLDEYFHDKLQASDPITQIAYLYAGISGESLNDLLIVHPVSNIIHDIGNLSNERYTEQPRSESDIEYGVLYYNYKCILRPKMYALYTGVVQFVLNKGYTDPKKLICTEKTFPDVILLVHHPNLINAFVDCMFAFYVNTKYDIKSRRKTSVEQIEQGRKMWFSFRTLFSHIYEINKNFITKECIDYFQIPISSTAVPLSTS